MKDRIIVATEEELVSLIEETVRRVLSEKKQATEQPGNNSSFLLSLKEAAGFLKLAPQTIYGFTSKRVIPFLKRGKKLYFKRADLEQWLEAGKKKSVSELKREIELNGTLKF
ncbi:MAG TPA: helix-turn-helix domain-containing protein [Cytophagaceae bacterium]|jgi:excisionase family DNA binding protein|nr:helix-turn-helix domain-containing protein [Cytophagaceae bacterium]